MKTIKPSALFPPSKDIFGNRGYSHYSMVTKLGDIRPQLVPPDTVAKPS